MVRFEQVRQDILDDDLSETPYKLRPHIPVQIAREAFKEISIFREQAYAVPGG